MCFMPNLSVAMQPQHPCLLCGHRLPILFRLGLTQVSWLTQAGVVAYWAA